jgi:DNA polymerase III gamma/tau subunit
MSLYSKHRPKRLVDIVGNTTTVALIQSFLQNGTLPHAILMSGPAGTGKTSTARILKTKLHCSDMDFSEINAADFRGIDTVREIREGMSLSPIAGDSKVYLIDESSRMSGDAQNALLKMLEDTPSHVYFILATTEPEKLIKTIRTRCTEFAMKPLSGKDMLALLDRTVKAEDKTLPDEVLEFIMEQSDGSARMALVLLEQALTLPDEDVLEKLTAFKTANTQGIDLCRALLNVQGTWNSIATILSNLEVEPETVRRIVLGYCASVILKAPGVKAEQASEIINYFEEPFWNGGKPALINACFRAYKAITRR